MNSFPAPPISFAHSCLSIRSWRRLAFSFTTLLLLSNPTGAAIYTVGPGCSAATIQQAVDLAEASPGPDEVRVSRHPNFVEQVLVGQTSSDQILISGGWDGCSAVGRSGRSLLVAPGGSFGAVSAATGASLGLQDMEIDGNGEFGVTAGFASDLFLQNTLVINSDIGVNMNQDSAVSIDQLSVIRDNQTTFDNRGAGISCGAGPPGGHLFLAGKVHSNSGPNGAGIYGTTGCTIQLAEGAEIYDNHATQGGGGIHLRNGATLTTIPGAALVSLHDNSAERGGGLYMTDAASAATLTDVRVHDNDATYGGGIYLQSSNRVDLVGQTSIDGNDATSQGGGVAAYSGSVVALTGGVRILGNSAVNGGGVYLATTAHMGGAGVPPEHMSISSNTATYGGGIYLTGAGTSANLNNFLIINNTAATAGGGVAVRSGASFKLDRSNGLPCADPPRCATLSLNHLSSGTLGLALFVDGGAQAELYQVYAETNHHFIPAAASRVFAADGAGTTLHLEGVQLWKNQASHLIGATGTATVTAGFVSAARNEWRLDPDDPLDVIGAAASGGGTVSLNSSILIDTRGYTGNVVDDCLLVDDESGLAPSSTRMVGADPMFFDAEVSGDLHLRGGSPAIDYCDTLVFNPNDPLDVDLDNRGFDLPNTSNILGPYDLGIDESLLDSGLFADGFESGDTTAW